MEAWKNHVALVTGATSGIGAAVAEDLGAAGMRVVIAGRRADRLRAVADVIDPKGDRVHLAALDVRDEPAVVAMFDAVRERWGGVDVLVNNAGLGHHAPLLEGDTAQWREMLEVNVLALCVCTREAVRDMRRNDRGHVIHLSSMAAHRVPAGSGVYSATKFAVRSLTEGLRLELRAAKSNVRVTAISPAYVETEFAEKYHRSAEVAREIYSHYKVLEARDVAAAVRYALSQPPHVEVHDILLRATQQPT